MVRSMKAVNVKKDNSEIEKEIKKALFGGKKKKISQADADYGFVEPDEKEVTQMIEGKIRDRIHLQNNLRKQQLSCNYAWSEIEELEKIHKAYNGVPFKDKSIKPKIIPKPKWYGIDMPLTVLTAEINCKIHDWKEMMRTRQHGIQALINVGFDTEKHINPILTKGKIISDTELLKKLESDYIKKHPDSNEEDIK